MPPADLKSSLRSLRHSSTDRIVGAEWMVKWRGTLLCERLCFVENFIPLYKQPPASSLWLSRIRERRKFGLIYFPWEKGVWRGGWVEGVEKKRQNKVSLWSQCSTLICPLIAQTYKSCLSMCEERVWRWGNNKGERQGVCFRVCSLQRLCGTQTRRSCSLSKPMGLCVFLLNTAFLTRVDVSLRICMWGHLI